MVKGEDAYKYFTWTATYGTASPLGVAQQVGIAYSYSQSCFRAEWLFSWLWIWVNLDCVSQCIDVNLQVILINGQFPGPRLDLVTNDNVILNLINNLDQPLLLTW